MKGHGPIDAISKEKRKQSLVESVHRRYLPQTLFAWRIHHCRLPSLQLILILPNVRFIHGSGFCYVKLSSCDIESWNDSDVFLIDILSHKLIRNFEK
jgi:hypothetical protein